MEFSIKERGGRTREVTECGQEPKAQNVDPGFRRSSSGLKAMSEVGKKRERLRVN